jgi:hypothetical protein
MPDVLRALAISAGILSLVVVLTVVVSITAVRRGEQGHAAVDHGHPADSPATKDAAAAAPAKTGKTVAAAKDEINVMQILLFGLILFTLSVLILLGLSLIQHLT